MTATRESELDRLPVVRHFRMRGLQMTRVETFTDAAFAFAVTLLVVTQEMPQDLPALMEAFWQVPAFAASFATLLLFYHGHHTFSQRYGLSDKTTTLLSWLLVFTVLVYIFPLRFFFGIFQSGLTGHGTLHLNSMAELTLLFRVYGIGWMAMSLLVLLLYCHAQRRAKDLDLNPIEKLITRHSIRQWFLFVLVGLVSVGLTFTNLPDHLAIPAWCYSGLGFIMPIHAVYANRAEREFLGASRKKTTAAKDS